MNAEQLNSARLARWSQNGEARLTLEAATEWLAEIGFCRYLPMGMTGGVPAPSFLEAVVGRPAPAPSGGERARALELLARLIENSSVVPLKLDALAGEQPDFVCNPDVLRFVYALRGDRNFKTGPLTVGNEKVTPLSLHCWQAIEQQGPMDVASLQPILGRDITEAAIVRALQELWSAMYIFPAIRAGGGPAQWELMFRRFPKPVAGGASTGHAEAQSALISLYLQAVVAAREEEILAFLSPLAPQSKLREVIRGLGSMRQLEILDIGGRAHVALQGGLLPEMVAQLSEELMAAAPSSSAAVEGEPEIGMEAEIESEAEIEMDSGTEMDSGIQIETVLPQQRASRSQPLRDSGASARSPIKKFVPKKFVPRQVDPRGPGAARFVAAASDDERSQRRPFSGGPRSGISGASRAEGNSGPRARGFAASTERSGGGARFGRSRPERTGQAPSGANRSGSARLGPGRFEHDGDSRDARGLRNRESFSRDRGERGTSAGAQRGYAGKGRGMGERAKRWQKAGEVPEAVHDDRPFMPRSPGSKPWQSKSSGAGVREGRYKKPWKKFEGAGGIRNDSPRGGTGKPYGSKSSGFKPRGARSWAGKSKDGQPFSRSSRPSSLPDGGDQPKSWQGSHQDSGDRRAGGKPWTSKREGPGASKGAGSRIGSAKSYAARSPAKPYAKTGGAKPWAWRSASEGGDEIAPKRREPKERREAKEGSGNPPRENRGAKPFWAKNPRGGKGSSGASRTNRPRGKKTARKSGKKK